jgi:hypothetical protein
MSYHVLTVRIAGEPPAFRGKARFCKKDTVKRRKEKERVLVMMRFANLRQNTAMVNGWGQEYLSDSSFQSITLLLG